MMVDMSKNRLEKFFIFHVYTRVSKVVYCRRGGKNGCAAVDLRNTKTEKDLKMKKLLMMAAACALAVAAKADGEVIKYTYTWTVDISDVDSTYTLPTDACVYLRGLGADVVYAQMSMEHFKYNDSSKIYELTAYSASGVDYKTGSMSVGNDSVHPGKVSYHFQLTFDTAQNLTTQYKDTTASSLFVTKIQGTDPVSKVLRSQTLAINWSNDSTFSSTGTYAPTPVPEPTSGLLFMIGLAGLALKRKRAA